MRAAGEAAGHLERRGDAVRRDEAELPRGSRVAAAGDEHGAEPVERRAAGIPVGEGQPRVARAAVAVRGDRARVGGGRALGLEQRRRLAAGPRRLEERAVGLLRRVREPPPERG